MPVSTDVIESIFGKFKVLIQRHPKAEINRLAPAIPAICHGQNEEFITAAIRSVSHKELAEWSKEHIPQTQRIKRRVLLPNRQPFQKVGKIYYAGDP